MVQQLLDDGRFEVATFDIRDPEVKGNWANVGDLRETAAVMDAVKGMDVVFHCAAITPSQDTEAHRQLMREVNIGGTLAVVTACKAHKVPRLVFTSSSSVVYEGKDLVGVDETTPYALNPADVYNETKAAAEKLVLDANCPGLLTCALRPASVFGEGDPLFVPSLVRNARAGKTKYYIGSGKNLTDFTYVGNIAAAHIMAADALKEASSAPAGNAYFITNDEPKLFWGFCGDVLQGLGYARPHIGMPFWLVYGIALLLKFVIIPLLALFGKRISPSLTPLAIRLSSSNRTFSCAKAKRDFGYRPLTSMDEALRRTLAAFTKLRNETSKTR